MIVGMDLTLRQANRVLEQAVKCGATLTIEPRVWDDEEPLCGTVAARDANLLRIDLHDNGRERALTGLVGAFCDVQTVLSSQLYIF